MECGKFDSFSYLSVRQSTVRASLAPRPLSCFAGCLCPLLFRACNGPVSALIGSRRP